MIGFMVQPFGLGHRVTPVMHDFQMIFVGPTGAVEQLAQDAQCLGKQLNKAHSIHVLTHQ